MIEPAASRMPDGLSNLAQEATSFGINNVATLVEQWRAGTHRYEKPGEMLLVAIDGVSGHVVGVGGLSRCPDVEDALRVRRFYVAADARRQGIAEQIALQLVAHGTKHAELLTCNAGASDAAAPFWEAMGFVRSDLSGITHVRGVPS